MRSPEAFTPLPEVYQQSERVRFSVPFPSWVETREIGVNLARTESLMNWGGIRHLRVEGKTGDKTLAMPVTVGIAPDGSAYAGKMGAVEQVQTHETSTDIGRQRSILRNNNWGSVTISLNMEEVAKRIREKDGNLRQAQAWTPHLDSALRSGLRKSGKEHLLKLTRGQIFFALFINVNNTLLSSANLSLIDILVRNRPEIPTFWGLVGSCAFSFSFWTSIETIMRGIEKNGSGYRISLLPGFEIDRALALQVLTRTKPLIKPLEAKKKP